MTPELRSDFFRLCLTEPIAGCRIASTFLSYPIGDDADYWLLLDEEEHPCGVLCRFHGLFSLIALDGTQWEELSQFLQAQDCPELEGDLLAVDPLITRYWPREPVDYWKGTSMLHSGIWQRAPRHPVVQASRLRETYQIFADSLPYMLDSHPMDRWYLDMNHRMRHGHVEIYEIQEAGIPVATAGLYGFVGRWSYLGCVATLERCRGKGYASDLVRALVNHSLKRGALPGLMCAEETLVPFYEALGFEVSGTFTTVALKEEKSPAGQEEEDHAADIF